MTSARLSLDRVIDLADLTYYVAVTLDGFIAAPDDGTGFLPPTATACRPSRHLPGDLPVHFRGQLGIVRTLTRDARNGVWLCGGGRLAGALLDEIHVLLVHTHTESCDSGDYQRLPP